MTRRDLSVRAAGPVAPVLAAPVVAVLVMVTTYLTARVALDLFKVPGAASAMWWPAAGVALAIVVRCPRRWWWLLLLGFAVGNTVANGELGGWAVTVSYSLVNVLEIAVAGLLLVDRGHPGARRLRTPADALRFVVAFAAAIAVGSAVIAIRTLIAQPGAPVHEIVGGYAITHTLGLLAIAPLLLPGRLRWRTSLGRDIEFVAVIVATLALDYWVFITPAQAGRAFPALLPVIWAAIRLRPWRTTVVTLLTCGMAAFGTARGWGTFGEITNVMQRQLVTQMMIGTVCLTALVLVLITRHREQLAAHARDSEETLRVAIRDAMVGMYSIRLDLGHVGEVSDVNLAFAAMLGYRPEELIGRNSKIFSVPDAADEAEFDGWMSEFARGNPESFRRETGFYGASGERRWVEVSATRVQPTSGPPFALVHVHDLTDREQTKQLLERMALHDALTGLPNRTLLFERLEQQLLAAARDGGWVGLLYLDLDGFKPVNDEHGHDAGDAVLVEVARRLEAAVRAGDTVARLGGDEFAILCPRVVGEADLDRISERVHRAMQQPIDLPDGTAVTISVSMGRAVSGRAGAADELVRRADEAMYGAKREARADRAMVRQRRVSDTTS